MCPGLPWVFFALELIDEFDRGEAAHPQLMMHDGLHADGGSQMRLPRAWATDEHDVVGVLDCWLYYSDQVSLTMPIDGLPGPLY